MVETRKIVTIVFSDVSGSTALGERLDAEALRRVMERYFEEMRSILERHGGTVEKFIGDAVMAAFGIPVAHEDDPLRAVRAAVEMRARLAELNVELARERGVTLAVRTGINTGEVVAGDPTEGHFYASGDVVNIAARLEQAAEPGEILLGGQTFRLVHDAVQVEALEPLALKGKSSAVPAYRLLEFFEGAPGLARRFDTPFVGREDELASLLESFHRAVHDHTPVLLTVLGPAGIGKTRLAAEFTSEIHEQATILRGRCLAYGEGITFWPLQEILLGLSERPVGAPDPEQSTSTEETFWAYRKLFEALGRERPLVLVLEDIHWAEPTLLDLLEHIVEWTEDARLLVLCLARPEFVDERPGWSGTRLNLEALSEEGSDDIISTLAPQLDPLSRSRAVRAAEGNPLFLEQLLALAVEDGQEQALPHSIQALLAARLDRLEANERALLERAAVIGKEFWRGALVHLSPPDTLVSPLLQGLVRKRLIQPERSTFPGEDGFRFGHMLIREATYQGTAKEIRARAHERFADWLEGSASAYGEIVGYHLEQAYAYQAELGPVTEEVRSLGDRASNVLGRAGQDALVRGDAAAAVNLLERARSLQSDDGKRLDLALQLALGLQWLGELEHARTLLSDVIEEATARGDRQHEWLGRIEYAELGTGLAPEEWDHRIKGLAEHALREFEELSDDIGLAHAWKLAALASWNRCRYDEAGRAYARALAHAQRAGDEQLELSTQMRLLQSMYFGSAHVSQVRTEAEEVLARVGESSGPGFRTLLTLAGVNSMAGAAKEARELFERAKSIGEELRIKWAPTSTAIFADDVGLLVGDAGFAETEIRAGYEFLEAIGEQGFRSTLAARLADALYQLGRHDEAEHFADLSLEITSEDDIASQAWARVAKAKLLAARGEAGAALQLAHEAVGFAQDTDDLYMHGLVLITVADVLEAAGRIDEAIPVLKSAVDVSERKGNVVTAHEARSRLDKLATVPR
jgi:class 3 adenylate cyclase/tetratricopeptide (TPR) repeat protein